MSVNQQDKYLRHQTQNYHPQKTPFKKRKSGFISTSQLILIAFAIAFFPRILDSLGAPSPVNFLHFVAVPFACGVAILTSKSRNRQQIAITKKIITGLFYLMVITFASALLNKAGAINAVLTLMLLGEPFLMVLAIISIPMSKASLQRFQIWIIRFLSCHVFLAMIQKYILRVETWNHLLLEPPDRIQGVFFLSGAGHVVGGAVSLTFGLYYLICAKTAPYWLRVIVALATFWHVIVSDAKQVILVFMVAGLLLLLTKLKDISEAIKYAIGAVLFGYTFFWCVQNVEAFSAFGVWIRPELYGPNGEATLLKMATFRIVPDHYESFLNWFFGLGPGHTVSRLGGWMLAQYKSLLEPLGSTIHPASRDVWRAVGASWLGTQSSLFSPLFSWAGIWGDLGFLGLFTYLYLGALLWHHLCFEDVSRLLLLTVFFFGLIFSQLEEPGYMLTVATILGLRWQEKQTLLNQRY